MNYELLADAAKAGTKARSTKESRALICAIYLYIRAALIVSNFAQHEAPDQRLQPAAQWEMQMAEGALRMLLMAFATDEGSPGPEDRYNTSGQSWKRKVI